MTLTYTTHMTYSVKYNTTLFRLITIRQQRTNVRGKFRPAERMSRYRLSYRRYVQVGNPWIKNLYITSIMNTDAGTYTCSATISGQQQRKTVTLRLFSLFIVLTSSFH